MKIVVVGGGISGVSAAYILKKYTTNEVTLIEKNPFIGGKACTFKEDGYTIEAGPNGFLDNKEEIKKLIEESNFGDNVIQSKDDARRRFIFSNSKLYELPENPVNLLFNIFNNFLTPLGRLRIVEEFFIKAKMEDETLESFVKRRLGQEMLDKLIGPMACGVYAGNPKNMSMDSTFLRIKEIERQYGSLIKGLIVLMKERKANTSSASGPFSAKLMSFKMGVGSFIKHLSSNIVVINNTVVSLRKNSKRYVIELENGSIEADCVVFAIPSYALSKIFKAMDRDFSQILSSIEYAPVNVVSLGFDRKNLPDVTNSFGYLFNLRDIRDVIGVLFDSSIFDFRADKNKLLVRVVIGGALKSDSAYKQNPIELSVKELQRSAKIFKPFEYSHVERYAKAIPQYGLNHKNILKDVACFEENNGGIFITGNAFYGVSLNDCVKASYNLLNKID